MLKTVLVCLIAGIGAGIGTGFAGLSAATVISPLLIVLLGVPAYEAVAIALASDVLASLITSVTYAKRHYIDIVDGIVMLITVLLLTIVGSMLASQMPDMTMGYFSTIITAGLGLKFLFFPNMKTNAHNAAKSGKQRILESLFAGIYIGFVCGFIGAGGGLMMLFVLTSVLGYEQKTAVGTSVFVMTFTALTGSVSHIIIGGMPDLTILLLCIVFTFIAARMSAVVATKETPATLNRVTGVILTITGVSMTILKIMSHTT